MDVFLNDHHFEPFKNDRFFWVTIILNRPPILVTVLTESHQSSEELLHVWLAWAQLMAIQKSGERNSFV